MKILVTIIQVCILFIFSFVGTLIHNFFHLAIPGSIIGLVLLFLCLSLKTVPVRFIENGASFLLSILILFFIPTTVGIMNYPSLLSIQGAWFALAVLLSTFATIAIAGIVSQLFENKANKRKEVKECNKQPTHS